MTYLQDAVLAKVGSDWNKPDGLCVIRPEQVDDFVKQLPVSRVFGVGQVTGEKLQRLGVRTCGDLRRWTVFELSDLFGSFGQRLYDLSRGVDERPVKSSRFRKSLSVEHTYARDVENSEACLEKLADLFAELLRHLAELQKRKPLANGPAMVAKQFVKVKFNNFQSTTVECVNIGQPRLPLYRQLCGDALLRGEGLPVRLLGLGVRFQENLHSPQQLLLFGE